MMQTMSHSETDQLPQLHHILMQAQEHLDNPTIGLPLDFSFTWDGIVFQAHLGKPHFGQCTLNLRAQLGVLPFSAQDPDARKTAIAETERSKFRTHDHILLDKTGHISLESATIFDAPTDFDSILETMTIILISLDSKISSLRGRLPQT
ncbi:hypothetical protein GCM10007972_18860 [Iodidimonas muriae]|uniref:YbjN domain-containing protein n=1 Tax=Iodidimonas muriae TaxID=261467 RepID=A0ABQ2LF12_9PROT|nr:hypothetical protein [Iodidimonas muriae]GGO13062.1 hypothetical protein GCM10007972_18860 [Iodidimonas muriae]